MGGNIFNHEDKIIRPSQYNANSNYGLKITLRQIIKLSTTEYLEKDLMEILPSWNDRLSGTHHISFSENAMVVDASEKIFSFY